MPVFFQLLRSPEMQDRLSAVHGVPSVVVHLEDADSSGDESRDLARRAHTLNCVLVGVAGPASADLPSWVLDMFDVILHDAESPPPEGSVLVHDVDEAAGSLASAIERHPIAAVTLVLLLRSAETLDTERALVMESTAYSVLQSGPEFAAWLASRPRPRARSAPQGPVIIASREGELLHLTLNQGHVHNAYSLQMRDVMCEFLRLASSDPSISRLLIDGAGASFCSGGFLDEFGSLPDPATAHLVRLTRSAGMFLARLSERVEVRIHGSAVGAGIELAAFAGVVTADPSARISLPELELGLLPGAGGTTSLPRRIGRRRTCYLALSGTPIDARTALSWGLIDAISPREDWRPVPAGGDDAARATKPGT